MNKLVIKSFKYRIYPTKKQMQLINSYFKAINYVYNNYINTNQSVFNLQQEIKKLKLNNNIFSKIEPQILLCQIRKTKKAKNIKLNHKQVLYFNNSNKIIELKNKCIKIKPLGRLYCKVTYKPINDIKYGIIKLDNCGSYYLILIADKEEVNSNKSTNKSIGIDLGLKNLITTSDGKLFENIINKEDEEKLIKLHKNLSNKEKNSNNYQRDKLKLAKYYKVISNKRKYYIHNITNYLIKNYDIICMEDISAKQLIKNNNSITKTIYKSNWYEIKRQLSYKTKWNNKKLIIVDKYFPSSQLCNVCGYKDYRLKDLSIRHWFCAKCDTYHDRDVNAAINILNQGLKIV